MSQIANENPLDSGNDANSVESAAADFTRMLNDEEQPSRSEAEKPRSRSSEHSEGEDEGKRRKPNRSEAPDTDTEDDGQSPADDDHDDEFLSGISQEEENEDEDDDGSEDTGEDDEDDGNGAENEDEDDDDDLDWDREIEFDVHGKTEKLKLSDLRDGYYRDADYRRKTAQLSEERREVEEYAAEAVSERKHYAETLQGFVDMTAALEPSQADWEALRRSNPDLYIQTKEQWEGIRAKVDEAKAEIGKTREREEAEANRQHVQYVREENRKLLEMVPQLSNPAKAKVFRDTILSYGKSVGFTEDELVAGAVDHRTVLTLYRAAKYDEIQRSRKAGQRRPNKEKGEPKNSPSSRPRTIGKGKSKGSRNERDADRRLARTGSQEDAAMAFTRMLES